MAFNEIEQYVNQVEQIFFYGPFSEDTVRQDLQLRESMDIRSGRRTNNLGEKQNVYISDINVALGTINKIIGATHIHRGDTTFLSKCERCQNQLNKLLDIVRSF